MMFFKFVILSCAALRLKSESDEKVELYKGKTHTYSLTNYGSERNSLTSQSTMHKKNKRLGTVKSLFYIRTIETCA